LSPEHPPPISVARLGSRLPSALRASAPASHQRCAPRLPPPISVARLGSRLPAALHTPASRSSNSVAPTSPSLLQQHCTHQPLAPPTALHPPAPASCAPRPLASTCVARLWLPIPYSPKAPPLQPTTPVGRLPVHRLWGVQGHTQPDAKQNFLPRSAAFRSAQFEAGRSRIRRGKSQGSWNAGDQG